MNKKHLLTALLSFIAGILLTAAATLILFKKIQIIATDKAVMSDAIELTQAVTWANTIRRGDLNTYYSEIDNRISADLPLIYSYYQSDPTLIDHGWKNGAIRAVNTYYTENHLPVPESIKPILATVSKD